MINNQIDFISINIEAIPQDVKQELEDQTGVNKEIQRRDTNILEPKIIQSHGKANVWIKEGFGNDPIFIDDIIRGGNHEVLRNTMSANLHRNASNLIGRNFIMWQDNDPIIIE